MEALGNDLIGVLFFFLSFFPHPVDDIRMQFRMHHQWPGKLSFESNAVVFSVSG